MDCIQVSPQCSLLWFLLRVLTSGSPCEHELPKSTPRIELSLKGLRLHATAGMSDREKVRGAGGSTILPGTESKTKILGSHQRKIACL